MVFRQYLERLTLQFQETLASDEDLYTGDVCCDVNPEPNIPRFVMTGGGAVLRGQTLKVRWSIPLVTVETIVHFLIASGLPPRGGQHRRFPPRGVTRARCRCVCNGPS